MTEVHVLHVIPGLLPGGMELSMARVISGLDSGRMRHSVVCMKSEPKIADRLPPSTEIHCMHARPNEPQLPLRLARLIRRVRPTVIHARNWGAWPDTAAARMLARPSTPLILSFHGLGKAGYMPLRRRLASRFLARMATWLFTVSRASKALMVSTWGWPENRVGVIPNGVDTDRFRPNGRRDTAGRVVLGTVGNLRPVKNHALLIRACAELVARGLDVEVRIAGEGKERANLTALAEQVGMWDRLNLYGRVTEVPEFLQELDVFVLSSDSEQHPNALNEAMACGLACVSTRVGCAEELLDGGRCGRIVAPGDVPGMARACEELIAAPALRRTLGDAARRRACDAYSLTQMLDAYDQMYRRVSDGQGAQP